MPTEDASPASAAGRADAGAPRLPVGRAARLAEYRPDLLPVSPSGASDAGMIPLPGANVRAKLAEFRPEEERPKLRRPLVASATCNLPISPPGSPMNEESCPETFVKLQTRVLDMDSRLWGIAKRMEEIQSITTSQNGVARDSEDAFRRLDEKIRKFQTWVQELVKESVGSRLDQLKSELLLRMHDLEDLGAAAGAGAARAEQAAAKLEMDLDRRCGAADSELEQLRARLADLQKTAEEIGASATAASDEGKQACLQAIEGLEASYSRSFAAMEEKLQQQQRSLQGDLERLSQELATSAAASAAATDEVKKEGSEAVAALEAALGRRVDSLEAALEPLRAAQAEARQVLEELATSAAATAVAADEANKKGSEAIAALEAALARRLDGLEAALEPLRAAQVEARQALEELATSAAASAAAADEVKKEGPEAVAALEASFARRFDSFEAALEPLRAAQAEARQALEELATSTAAGAAAADEVKKEGSEAVAALEAALGRRLDSVEAALEPLRAAQAETRQALEDLAARAAASAEAEAGEAKHATAEAVAALAEELNRNVRALEQKVEDERQAGREEMQAMAQELRASAAQGTAAGEEARLACLQAVDGLEASLSRSLATFEQKLLEHRGACQEELQATAKDLHALIAAAGSTAEEEGRLAGVHANAILARLVCLEDGSRRHEEQLEHLLRLGELGGPASPASPVTDIGKETEERKLSGSGCVFFALDGHDMEEAAATVEDRLQRLEETIRAQAEDGRAQLDNVRDVLTKTIAEAKETHCLLTERGSQVQALDSILRNMQEKELGDLHQQLGTLQGKQAQVEAWAREILGEQGSQVRTLVDLVRGMQEQDVCDLRRQLAAVQGDLPKARDLVDAQGRQLQALTDLVHSIREQDVHDVRGQLDQVHEELTKVRQTRELHGQVNTLNELIRSIQDQSCFAKLDELQRAQAEDIRELRAQVDGLKCENTKAQTLQGLLDAQGAQVQSLSGLIQGMQAQTASHARLEETQRIHTEELAALRQQVEGVHGELAKVQEIKVLLGEQEKQVQSLSEHLLQSLAGQAGLTRLEEAHNSMVQDLREVRASLDALRGELVEAQQTRELLGEQDRQVQSLTDAVRCLQEQVHDLQGQVMVMHSPMGEAVGPASLEDAGSLAGGDIRAKISELEGHVEVHSKLLNQNSAAVLAADVRALSRTIAASEATIDALTSRLLSTPGRTLKKAKSVGPTMELGAGRRAALAGGHSPASTATSGSPSRSRKPELEVVAECIGATEAAVASLVPRLRGASSATLQPGSSDPTPRAEALPLCAEVRALERRISAGEVAVQALMPRLLQVARSRSNDEAFAPPAKDSRGRRGEHLHRPPPPATARGPLVRSRSLGAIACVQEAAQGCLSWYRGGQGPGR